MVLQIARKFPSSPRSTVKHQSASGVVTSLDGLSRTKRFYLSTRWRFVMHRAWVVGMGACAALALAGFAWNSRASQNPEALNAAPAAAANAGPGKPAEHPL